MLIKYTPIERSIETYQLVLFKELNYTFQNFASDVFKFFILISLFSILFFVIGYYFVRITLRPVADNIDEMDNFVHNAGHELKTPLAVVSSNLQLMKQMK
jgi:signal transduction histidine kinase